jgi:hypothetical protein
MNADAKRNVKCVADSDGHKSETDLSKGFHEYDGGVGSIATYEQPTLEFFSPLKNSVQQVAQTANCSKWPPELAMPVQMQISLSRNGCHCQVALS